MKAGSDQFGYTPRIECWVAALLLTASSTAIAEPLFDGDAVMNIRIEGPLSELFDDEHPAPRDFMLTASASSYPVRIDTYGKSRRRVCHFPLLRVVFEEATPLLEGNAPAERTIRLVTRCKNTQGAEVNLAEEYIAYRILNLLTDFSYRVRLLRVGYRDASSDGKAETAHAFAVESEHALARRLGGDLLNLNALPKARLDESHAALVYVFQYLIGNTDWSLVTAHEDTYCCHNGQLMQKEGSIVFLPYDFDISGLVNPPYARPDPSLRIKRVTRRLYRGYCGPTEALRAALDRVTVRREAILDLVRQAPLLSSRARERDIRYLESFFREAQDPEKLLEKFQRSCLG